MIVNTRHSGQQSQVDIEAKLCCRSAQILILIVAAMIHGVCLSKAKPLQSANDRSRWCTVWSLVERGTFQIDEIRQRSGWDTIDIVYVDGHFYSTKPPLLTCCVAGIVWCIKQTLGWNLLEQTQSVTFIVLLVTNLVPFVISLIAWIAILDRISEFPWTRLFATVIAAFATLLSPFLMTLNNHTVAAAAVMVALFTLLEILRLDDERPKRWSFVLCGFATSWAVVNEFPAAAFGACACLLAFQRSPKNAMAYLLPSAAIPIVALIATNYMETGSWKPIYADYGTEKYRFVYQGVPSYWLQPVGIDRNLDDPLTYFLHCVIGHHGLFSLTPIALLSIAGWLTSFRCRDENLKKLLWTGALTSAVVMLFYMLQTEHYNYGGVSCGLRWALWLTPLWLMALVPILDASKNSTLIKSVEVILVMVSMFSAWQPIDNPWRQPWLFQWMEDRGWIDYSDDQPSMPKPLWTWFSTLPATTLDDPAWVEFAVAQPWGGSRMIRLTARPDLSAPVGERMEIEVRETFGDKSPDRIRKLQLDIEKFNEGGAPAEFLNWSDPNVTEERQQSDLAFVRGLPRKIPFQWRSTRYLKNTLRPEAFCCKHVTAHLACSVDDGDEALTHRCEAWLTDDVPFGVAQVEFHINNLEKNSTLFHERWTIHDCWPKVRPYEFPKTLPKR